MAKLTKASKAANEKVEAGRSYAIDDALALVKELAKAKFVESVDVAVNLGVDPKKSDQVVRGSTVLPHGTGKTVRVAVFTQGANAEAAQAEGADIVGMDDLAERMQGGDLNYDVVIASPDAMRVVGKLGQLLGPRGLMPNPKVGTVATGRRRRRAQREDRASALPDGQRRHGALRDRQREFELIMLQGEPRGAAGGPEQGEARFGQRRLSEARERLLDDGSRVHGRSGDRVQCIWCRLGFLFCGLRLPEGKKASLWRLTSKTVGPGLSPLARQG